MYMFNMVLIHLYHQDSLVVRAPTFSDGDQFRLTYETFKQKHDIQH